MSKQIRIVRSATRKTLAYRAGYCAARIFDHEGKPLELSTGDVLLQGGIVLLLLLGAYFFL